MRGGLLFLIFTLSLGARGATFKEVLREDFEKELTSWGLPPAQGDLHLTGWQPILVPMADVGDAVIEYRAFTEGEGLVELLFRYDIDNDLYYIFRVDTRKTGGDPPGFLKRSRGEPSWHLVGERTGEAPPPNTWVDVRVLIQGSLFQGYVNGELVATYQDEEYRRGFLAFRNQVKDGRIDDLRLLIPEGESFKLFPIPSPPPSSPPLPYREGSWHAHWIWHREGGSVLRCFLRKDFTLPNERIAFATLVITCDNEYRLYLNGKFVGKDERWEETEAYEVGGFLRPGKNVIAVEGRNWEKGGATGVLLQLGIVTTEGNYIEILSDESWKVSSEEEEDWESPTFNDEGWGNAVSFGKHPCPPWERTQLFIPYLGPRQPIELRGVEVPQSVRIGSNIKIKASWQVLRKFKDDHPLIVRGKQKEGNAIELAYLFPKTPTSQWEEGGVHTEIIEFPLSPMKCYFFQENAPVLLEVEVGGTFYKGKSDFVIGQTRLLKEKPKISLDFPPLHRGLPPRKGEFRDRTGKTRKWQVDEEGRFLIEGVPYIPIEGGAGVYYCIDEGNSDALKPLDWKATSEEICREGGPKGMDMVRLRLVDYIDCSKEDHEFSDDFGLGGKSRVVEIGGRKYRLTSPRNRLSYFAYTLRCQEPQKPHLLLAQSVNDRERYTTIRIQPPWDNVGGGVYTGREYPCDGKPFTFMFIFYPRDKRIRLTVSRWPAELEQSAEDGAAVSYIWLFEILDHLGDMPVETLASPKGERRLGMYLTHPAYLYTLYGFKGQNEAERHASLRSFIDYMRFCGLNLFEFNAVDGADTTSVAYYDSKIWPPQGKLLEDLLPLCEEAGIKVIPIVTSLNAPAGQFNFTEESFQMDRFGNFTYFFASRPPLPDPLRPEVQGLLRNTLKEILEICKDSKAVPAVGFRVNGKIGLCYGGADLGTSDQYTGYSPWDVSQFEKDTGIDVPDIKPTPYRWIKEHCWEEWIEWRCKRMAEFWRSLRDMVNSYNKILYISCDMPSETPAWNIYWPNGTPPLECMRYHGTDPRMFREEKGILLQRGMMISADRYFTRMGQYGENVWALKAFHYAPGVAEMYEGKEGNACELYHNYWEEFGVFKQGEFATDFWGAGTMYPFGRYYFEPVCFSIAKTNCHTLNLFSWERGTFGQEHNLRSFARAFRALPPEEGEPAEDLVSPRGGGIWARWFGDRLAICNNQDKKIEVKIRWPVELPRGARIVEVGHLVTVVEKSEEPRRALTFSLPLAPYELRTLVMLR